MPRRAGRRLRSDRRAQMGIPRELEVRRENFLGDTYHNPTHRSVDLIGIGPSAAAGKKGRRDDELEKAQHVWISFPAGHGVHSAIQPDANEYVKSFLDNPVLERNFRHCFEETKATLGDQASCFRSSARYFPTPPIMAGSRGTMRLAPAQSDVHRRMALLPRRQGCAERGRGLPSPLLHALLGSGRNDRAGRHGELALRDCREHRNDPPGAIRSTISNRWERSRPIIRHRRRSQCSDHRTNCARILPPVDVHT